MFLLVLSAYCVVRGKHEKIYVVFLKTFYVRFGPEGGGDDGI